MRSLKANRVIKVSLINDELPPWHEDEVKTFYIQGFGFMFESRLSEVLKAEYLINLAFSKTRYLTMENVLFMFGLPSKYVDSQKYYWDYRSSEDVFITIDFQHEIMTVECNGDALECIVISFNQIPEIR